MISNGVSGSPSLSNQDYWWFVVRGRLLEAVFRQALPIGGRVLDVGSADGPSNTWMDSLCSKTAMDLDPRGLDLEGGDIVGSITDIPFPEATFDAVSAFDVVEHVSDEKRALDEVYRTLKPGGAFMMAVPAYEWAWTSHDDLQDHQRRYSRRRAIRSLRRSGFEIERSTHAFAGAFPFFAAERLLRRSRERMGKRVEVDALGLVPLPQISRPVARILFAVSRLDEEIIPKFDLPVGSSIFILARKPLAIPR